MRPGRVLITGASGFVGRHLARLLQERGHSVWGLSLGPTDILPAGVEPLFGDLGDPASLVDLPREWDSVIHLAGVTIPSEFKTSAPVLQNVAMGLNLLEHLESAKVLLVSSAHVYGPTLELRRESDPILPQGRYGLSKHLLEQLAPAFASKLDIRIARPFNHLGAGLRPELMVPSLLRRLEALDPSDASPVVMKGTNSIRDFIDVRDVTSAYLAILELEAPEHRVYNVCTGQGRSVAEVVHAVLDLLGTHREVVFENRMLSSDDNPFLVGSCERLTNATGWHPRVSLESSLKSMLPPEFQ